MKSETKQRKREIKNSKVAAGEYSVTKYAELAGVVRQTINWQIHNDCLPEGVTAKKIGAGYLVTVK